MRNLNHHFERVRVFICTWRVLAEYSWVDCWGSFEQRRVFEKWCAAGKPLPCRRFILKHANASAEVRK